MTQAQEILRMIEEEQFDGRKMPWIVRPTDSHDVNASVWEVVYQAFSERLKREIERTKDKKGNP
jgi:hypothetical protein